MRSDVRRFFHTTFVFLGLFLAPLPAAAQGKKECAVAFEKAQESKEAGKLRAAKEHTLVCSREECPGFIRQDCMKWHAEVKESLPSIVVVATNAEGKDLTEVRVEVGGEIVAASLDGRGIELDPGKHQIKFTYGDAEPVTQDIVLREGERNRRLEVTFAEPAPPPAQTASEVRPLQASDSSAEGDAPTLAYVLGGVGLVGLAGFTYFGLSGQSKHSDLSDSCKPNCSDARVDEVDQQFLFADISLGVGLVSLGVATYLFLTHDAPSKEQVARRSSAPQVGFSAGPRGAFGVLRQPF